MNRSSYFLYSVSSNIQTQILRSLTVYTVGVSIVLATIVVTFAFYRSQTLHLIHYRTVLELFKNKTPKFFRDNFNRLRSVEAKDQDTSKEQKGPSDSKGATKGKLQEMGAPLSRKPHDLEKG
jgi:hypothetical protein